MKRNHVQLICDVGELTGLFHDVPGMEDFLQKITAMVTQHMGCEVCSIYLYYQDNNELVLTATKGLNPSSIGQVKMKMGEGLTGLALKEHRPIYEGQARHNPNFRFFPGIGEERFESFLAMPILHGAVEIGVMVIQSEKKDHFSNEDIQAFRAITAQLATTIETARLLITLNTKRDNKQEIVSLADLKFVKGHPGSDGVVMGEVVVVDEAMTELNRFSHITHPYTEDDFHNAVHTTEMQLADLQKRIETALFDVAALIFTAQILMLKDKGFSDVIAGHIRQGVNPPQAVMLVVQDYVRKFSAIKDSYLQDKIYDVKDVGRRVLENMTGLKDHNADFEDRIVIARELLPSDAMKLFSQKVKGIILLSGGVTSHVAILSRSLNIPLVVVDEPGLLSVPSGTKILLDGVMGHIHVGPEEEMAKKIFEREDLNKDIGRLKGMIREFPQTKDGVAVKFMANINLLGDMKAATEFKAEGIGLYRTEFPFIIRSDFPSEEEQYIIYRRLVEGMAGKPVTFRTLDIGGDKLLSYYDYGKEANPFLGLRSIRFSLKHKDVFIQQIRAILRAGHGHNVRILFPMISSVDELLESKGIVQECIQALEIEGHKHITNPLIGIMIELPSVMEIIEELAEESDFFSIGTNDLVQYLLAVDRTNAKVADLYMPHHPSVLRALKKIVDAAHKYGKDVSICGDMANSVKFLPFLLGIGLRQFSLDARYLPRVHDKLSTIVLSEARAQTEVILQQSKVARTSQLMENL